ncbi:GNAT family N-acetyltransferase, partial [Micromonospora aurantiaca]|nr:GNAT family N-acetyltransferase [Micromonospora aurantiaca]
AAPPRDWEPVFVLEGLQMVWAGSGETYPDVVELGADDVPDMLDLVARTRPGPFWPRTHELGTYVGVRENGALV